MIRSSRLTVFLRFFFRLLYHQLAWSYDAVAFIVSLGRWKTWVYSVLPYLHGPRVLELGYGPGHLQLAMRRKGLRCTGVDASPQMARLAYLRFVRSGFDPGVIIGYAHLTPFPNHTFDQIVATFPSDYISRPDTLAEVRRLLKPDGEFLVLPVAWITGQKLIDRLATWLFRITHQAPSSRPVPVTNSAGSSPVIPDDLKDQFLKPLQAAGFSASVEIIQASSSILLLIHARTSAV